MRIEDLERWHWAIIGIIAGLALAILQNCVGRDMWLSGNEKISQHEFEQGLVAKPLDGKSIIRDIRVYPFGDLDFVFMHTLGNRDREHPRRWEYRNTVFIARRPYMPLKHGTKHAQTGGTVSAVVDYLAQNQEKHPSASWRYCWWSKPQYRLAIWTLGGCVAIGGIWPTMLGLLLGAGFGRRKAVPKYDLNRFRSEAAPVPGADGKRDDDEVQRLNAAMEKEIEANPVSAAPIAIAKTIHGPVLELNAGPAEPPLVTDRSSENREFDGEFYPVARAKK